MRLDRRAALAGLAGGIALFGLGGCQAGAATGAGFVRREGTRLLRDGELYRVAGANMWYAAWLGADAPFGDRARLGRELDRLKDLGLNNLRIMAAAEDWLRQAGIAKLQLLVRRENAQANAFYQSLGFEESTSVMFQKWLDGRASTT